MYTFYDQENQHSYYFDVCARADDVSSTECLTGVNNTRMPVYGCQVAYGRDGTISLGNEQELSAYASGQHNVPSMAGAAGVHVNISGGDRCHHNGNPHRQLDLWIKCNPTAGVGQPEAQPNGELETAYCEYDLVWESSHGCRLCTADDYVSTIIDPEPQDGVDGCRADGNWTIRYEKKPGVVCAHGEHDGAEVSKDLNEFCGACPTGFKKKVIEQLDFFECQACPAGQTSDTRNADSCRACTGDTFTDAPGSNQCFECGHGTVANADHTGCVFASGQNCRYHSGAGMTYDLSKMGSLERMYGPISDGSWGAHEYFLNLCTQSHVEHACYDKNNDPLVSYSCQVPSGGIYGSPAKDLGDTIGFTQLSGDKLAMYPNGGVLVELSRGSVCHHVGAQQHRSTEIIVACDASLGVGSPGAPARSTWNAGGDIEPNSACAYEFLWESRYGCPVCSLDSTYRLTDSSCDPSTGFVKKTYERTVPGCIGHPHTQDQLDSFSGPAVFEETGTERCVPSCLPGTQLQSVTGGQVCTACPAGTYGPGGNQQCQYCTGNTYTHDAGSPACIECGSGTTANDRHDECDLHDCKYTLGAKQYDLKPLDTQRDEMWGPLRDSASETGHVYFINLCTRQEADALTCADDSGTAIKSFACQRTTLTAETLGHLVAKNLGDTFGVEPADEGVLGLRVHLTHGTKCHRNGQPHRETTIEMTCDEAAGVGAPVPYQGYAEAGEYCKYKFSWASVHACPICTAEDYSSVVSECAQDDNGAYSQTTQWVKSGSCNTLSPAAYTPPATLRDACSLPKATGGASSEDVPWYKEPSFLITIIVVSSTVFAVIVTFALVKYYKIRRLYETYAQLDKDRGMNDDFHLPSDMELSSRDGGL